MRSIEKRRPHRRNAVFGVGAAITCAALVGLIGAPSLAVPRASASVEAPTLEARTVQGQTVSSRTVILRGSGLDDVASVSLGGVDLGAPRHLSSTRIAVRVGTAPDFAPATRRFALHRVSDDAVIETGARFAYIATSFRARELRWALANVGSRSYTWGHSYIDKYDCANFTSHALVMAGADASVLDVSSTSLRRKLLAGGAVELKDTQKNRAEVQLGDIIQFDWQPTTRNPGDRDHTGIVTGIERDATGKILIRYSAHTDGGNNPSKQLQVELTMDRPHHDPNGKVYFLHLAA